MLLFHSESGGMPPLVRPSSNGSVSVHLAEKSRSSESEPPHEDTPRYIQCKF